MFSASVECVRAKRVHTKVYDFLWFGSQRGLRFMKNGIK